MATSEEIRRDLIDELTWSAEVEVSNVRVDVTNGRAVLEGTVPFLPQKLRAQQIAESVPGVNTVENQLAVARSGMPTDQAIAQHIEASLRRHARLDAEPITVSVRDGRVTLAGTVDSTSAHDLAIEIAARKRGVVDLDDHLAIRPGA